MHNFLAKHQITQVTQLAYNPDLVPCNVWLFPKLKSPLKGKRLQMVNEIQENTKGQLMTIGITVWGPKVAYFKGDWGIIILCTVFLLSCIFFNKCLFFFFKCFMYFYYHWVPYIPLQSAHSCPCPWVLFPFCSIPLPPTLPSLAVILLSMSLFLFCLLVQFVH